MKRNVIVEMLINEGFSEKTLVKFTDKQLVDLHERLIVRAADLTDPNVKKIAADPTNQVQVVKEKKESASELKGNQKKLDKNHNGKIDAQDFKILKGQKKKDVKEEKPSAGLSKEKKSEVVKKAKKGADIGKKGKGFEKIADKAAKKYGSKEKGKKVAAAAMWKNIQKEGTEKWVDTITENEYFHSLTSKNEILDLIKTKLNESNTSKTDNFMDVADIKNVVINQLKK